MILVTGGAGFIGSHMVAALNRLGRRDVVVCDRLHDGPKWRNLRGSVFADFVPPRELRGWLDGRPVEAVIHLGTNASTLARDGDEVIESNFRLSLMLLDWCTDHGVPLIYASSAATYGDGARGFDDRDDGAFLATLRPLNLYGWSKHQVDQAVAARRERGGALPPACRGLKFFNVYGANETHKGEMRSVVRKAWETLNLGDEVQLFRSHHPGYADGEQERDFVWVDDVVAAICFLLTGPAGAGLLNVGSGTARTWLDLVRAVEGAMVIEPAVRFVELPEMLRGTYQYSTLADMGRLCRLGFEREGTTLEAGVRATVASLGP